MVAHAEIRVDAPLCAERTKLGASLTDAIQATYVSRKVLESARRTGKEVAAAFAELQRARELQLEAQRRYDGHVHEHGCAPLVTKASAAVAR